MRKKIFNLVSEYYKKSFIKKTFNPDSDTVKYAGRVFDENEIIAAVDSCLDFWLTEGRYCKLFSEKIADFLNVKNVILANSGSSANLLAISALCSEKLGKNRLKPGDEVITVAAGFPATVTPIIQNRLIPVFVDIDVPTYNINIQSLKKSITNKTRCIFLAHTLGNPFNIDEILEIVKENDLWLIEDNCDAFGTKYKHQYTGTFGHISTMSFYPAHQITTGEGGAVVTNDEKLSKIITSIRDWGRDCYCSGGNNNACGKRFIQQFGTLPIGYDHKYVYSELGYNLKMTEMQASIGSAQMDKLLLFCKKRKMHFSAYQKIFEKFKKYFILPEATEHSDPAWFSYILSVKDKSPFSRNDFVNFLNENRIETRNLFAGNIIRQPAFTKTKYRIAGKLETTDFVMNNSFFLGTYPGMTREMFDYVQKKVNQFMKDI